LKNRRLEYVVYIFSIAVILIFGSFIQRKILYGSLNWKDNTSFILGYGIVGISFAFLIFFVELQHRKKTSS